MRNSIPNSFKNELFVFNLYNQPNVLLNLEFFKTVNKKCLHILGGDLNARTKQKGCVGENENGIMLERIINELDFPVINDKLSSSLITIKIKITDFCVLNSQDMTSDHFSIEASISMGYQLENKSAAKELNYRKANWKLFSEILNSQIIVTSITDELSTILFNCLKNIFADFKKGNRLGQHLFIHILNNSWVILKLKQKNYKNEDKQSPLITALNFDSVRLIFFEPNISTSETSAFAIVRQLRIK
ncbi:hypothetical protein BpHYR1_048180 [Brachionus plicatilis]|uniref:RNA-directed DNA polymerase from mobile element jockey-like n=1 Tax=Brachionus plicatilis TaxID=10195 RepID=A0A3M7PBT2_BRAPC|nr:hypothetical protein BpHYR1_048180 [Brachionus plicatilis]